jgi:hypothetical protein
MSGFSIRNISNTTPNTETISTSKKSLRSRNPDEITRSLSSVAFQPQNNPSSATASSFTATSIKLEFDAEDEDGQECEIFSLDVVENSKSENLKESSKEEDEVYLHESLLNKTLVESQTKTNEVFNVVENSVLNIVENSKSENLKESSKEEDEVYPHESLLNKTLDESQTKTNELRFTEVNLDSPTKSSSENKHEQKKTKAEKFLSVAKEIATYTPVLQIAVVIYNLAKVLFTNKSFLEVFGAYTRKDFKNANITVVGLAVTAYYYTEKGIQNFINRNDISRIKQLKKVFKKSHLDSEQYNELVKFLTTNPIFTKVKELFESPNFKTEAKTFTEKFLAIDFDNPKKARPAMDQFNNEFVNWVREYLKTEDPNSLADFRIAFICSDREGYDKIFKKLQNIHPQQWHDLAKDSTGNLSGERTTLLSELGYNFRAVKKFHSTSIIEQKYNLSPAPTKEGYAKLTKKSLETQKALVTTYLSELETIISTVINVEKKNQFEEEFKRLNTADLFADLSSGPLTREEAEDIFENSQAIFDRVNKELLKTLNIDDINNSTARLQEESKAIETAKKRIDLAQTAKENPNDPSSISNEEIEIMSANAEIDRSQWIIDYIKEQQKLILQVNQVKRAFEQHLNVVMHLRHDIINEMIKQEES